LTFHFFNNQHFFKEKVKMEYRVPIIIALVVLLIVVFIWKRRKPTTKGKKSSKKSTKKGSKSKGAPRQSNNNNDEDDYDDDDTESYEKPSSSGDIAGDAKELYDIVHNELAGGMQIDEFEDAAGDLAGDDAAEVFVALKQKYTESIDSNRDPMRSVTVKDYIEVLKKTG
jgi:hypothetical protein